MTRYELDEVTAWRVIAEDGTVVSGLFSDYDEALNELETWREEEDYQEMVRNERW